MCDLFFGAGLAFAELPLDGFDLLAQEGAALGIGKLRLHIFLQLLLDLRDFELRRNVCLHRAQTFLQIQLFKDRLLLRHIDVQIRSEEIDQLFRIIDIANSALD